MIDDFEVADDPGYGFDDYGPGRALTVDYLAGSVVAGWELLYPAVSSADEGGSKRGCCVLVSPSFGGLKFRGLRSVQAT
jgi:hypothetical protein